MPFVGKPVFEFENGEPPNAGAIELAHVPMPNNVRQICVVFFMFCI